MNNDTNENSINSETENKEVLDNNTILTETSFNEFENKDDISSANNIQAEKPTLFSKIKRILSFKGEIKRKEWWITIITILSMFVITNAFLMTLNHNYTIEFFQSQGKLALISNIYYTINYILALITLILIVYLYIIATIKRFRDMGVSLYVFLALVMLNFSLVFAAEYIPFLMEHKNITLIGTLITILLAGFKPSKK